MRDEELDRNHSAALALILFLWQLILPRLTICPAIQMAGEAGAR